MTAPIDRLRKVMADRDTSWTAATRVPGVSELFGLVYDTDDNAMLYVFKSETTGGDVSYAVNRRGMSPREAASTIADWGVSPLPDIDTFTETVATSNQIAFVNRGDGRFEFYKNPQPALPTKKSRS